MGKQEEEYKFRDKWYQRLRYRNFASIVVLILIIYSLFLLTPPGRESLTGQFINTPVDRIHLTYFGSYTLDVNVTNEHNDTANITLILDPQGTNYIARFVNHPLANISESRHVLNTSGYAYAPGEERIFQVEIRAIKFEETDGNLSITANNKGCLPPCLTTINVSVNTQPPVDFPGIEVPAILLIISLAGLIYWRKY